VSEPELGIVLRSFFPAKQKASILFSRRGKQSVVILSQEICRKLSAGMIIQSQPFSRGGSSFFYIDYCDIKEALMGRGIPLFLVHRLCELCYYFLPEGLDAIEVVNFFNWLFEFCNDLRLNVSDKKALESLCEFKLLCLLSFYPPQNLASLVQVFHRLVSVSVDSKNTGRVISKEVIEMVLQEVAEHSTEIEKWMTECVSTHQLCKKFKTIRIGL
jgi:hypothetical protein